MLGGLFKLLFFVISSDRKGSRNPLISRTIVELKQGV